MGVSLLIDIGNTAIKYCLAREGKTGEVKNLRGATLDEWRYNLELILDEYIPDSVVLCSVRPGYGEIARHFLSSDQLYIVGPELKLPYQLDYETPGTLGADRIALVAGAAGYLPGNNLLVIDAGTCITLDLLVNGVYPGGAIFPGILMRARAMNTFTAGLPFIEPMKKVEPIGKSTADSIRSGTVNGVRLEIEGWIKMFKKKFPKLKVIITGGDLVYFDNLLKNNIFAVPDLLFRGLLEILTINEKNK